MKLPALLVDGFDDCQLNFETLQNDLTTPGAALPFLQLLTAKQVALNFGSVVLTWTTSANSAVAVVSHGLGRTPQVIFTQPVGALSLDAAITATSSSTFSVQGYTTTAAAISGSATFYWAAIG